MSQLIYSCFKPNKRGHAAVSRFLLEFSRKRNQVSHNQGMKSFKKKKNFPKHTPLPLFSRRTEAQEVVVKLKNIVNAKEQR